MVLPGFGNNNIVFTVIIAVAAVIFYRYFNSIISYIKRANIKSYIAVIFGQLNINIVGGCVAAYAVCSKSNTAAFKCGIAFVITVTAAG